MTLQLLIATMNGRFFARGYAPPFDEWLVIDQIDGEQPPPTAGRAKVFHYREKGLSKSRNRALQHAQAEIGLIGDDDVSYPQDAQRIITDAFAQNPRADIITFQAQTPNGELFNKRYPRRARWHNSRSIMRVSSWEIALRLASVRAARLRFDERFGLGARFPTGEENIFLLDALRCGLKLRYLPLPVVTHPAESSGGDFRNPELIAAKGAMFARMFGAAAEFVAFAFACKKYRLSDVSCRRFYQLMRRGIAAYRQGQ